MEVTIREAAALVGKSPRTLRAQLARGELQGRKRGHQWWVSMECLPLTAEQRTRMERRIDETREALESSIPRNARARRSTLDLAPVLALRRLLADMPEADEFAGPRDMLREALIDLCEAAQEYWPSERRPLLSGTRRRLGRALGALIAEGLQDDPVRNQLAERLESEVLPPLGGLIRWTEARRRNKKSDWEPA